LIFQLRSRRRVGVLLAVTLVTAGLATAQGALPAAAQADRLAADPAPAQALSTVAQFQGV
jgi:hypothetical protein